MANNLSTLSSTGLAGTPEGQGARYTLMSDWEAGAQALYGDLVAAGDTATLECYKGTTVEGNWDANGTLVENVDITGWTTGAGNFITVQAAAGNENFGVQGAGFKISSSSIISTIRNYQDYSEFRDLESENTNTGNFSACAFQQSNTVEYGGIERCILTSATTSTSDAAGTFSGGIFRGGFVRNNLIIPASTSSPAFSFDQRSNPPTDISNNTVLGELRWAQTTTTCFSVFSNNVFMGAAEGGITTHAAESTNNGFGSTGSFGADPVTVVTADDFVDYDNGDYRPAPAGLLAGAAVNLSADFTDDITGATRQSLPDPWDIGAYRVAGGPPPVGVKEMYVKDGGVFVKYTPYVKVGGAFQEVDAYVKSGGVWVPVHEK